MARPRQGYVNSAGERIPGVKTCWKCQQSKPVDSFYRNASKRDGRSDECKACDKARQQAKPLALTREGARLRQRRHREDPNVREREREYQQGWRSINSEQAKNYQRSVSQTVVCARAAVNNAVRDGRLQRAPACWNCGGTPVQAHHSSYAADMWLAVTWLCSQCHGQCHWRIDHG